MNQSCINTQVPSNITMKQVWKEPASSSLPLHPSFKACCWLDLLSGITLLPTGHSQPASLEMEPCQNPDFQPNFLAADQDRAPQGSYSLSATRQPPHRVIRKRPNLLLRWKLSPSLNISPSLLGLDACDIFPEAGKCEATWYPVVLCPYQKAAWDKGLLSRLLSNICS